MSQIKKGKNENALGKNVELLFASVLLCNISVHIQTPHLHIYLCMQLHVASVFELGIEKGATHVSPS